MRQKQILLTLLAAIVAVAFVLIPTQPALAQDDPDKLDKITLVDGQSYVGEIIEETDDSVTMIITVAGISAEKTFTKAQIGSIRRDAVDAPRRSGGSGMAGNISSTDEANRLADLPDPNDPRPVVYVIPFKGIVGWDTYEPIIRDLWEEALSVNADYVIFDFDCRDGFFDLEDTRDMIEEIKREADEHEVKLYAWIKQARGAAVAFALMFDHILFYPDGWMGDGESIDKFLKAMFEDSDVQSKMIAAWVGICRGMAIEGGHDSQLCEAMIRPEPKLYVQMEGENPHFVINPDAEHIASMHLLAVDEAEDAAVKLTADVAKKYGVTQADTARDLRTFMQRIGIREYVHYEGESTEKIDNWMAFRRNGWDKYQNLLAEIQLAPQLFNDPVKVAGKQLKHFREILSMLKRCPPHTKPPYWGLVMTDTGEELLYGIVSLEAIELQIEQIQRQLQEMNDQRRGRGGGGGGGRGGGGGGGGGG